MPIRVRCTCGAQLAAPLGGHPGNVRAAAVTLMRRCRYTDGADCALGIALDSDEANGIRGPAIECLGALKASDRLCALLVEKATKNDVRKKICAAVEAIDKKRAIAQYRRLIRHENAGGQMIEMAEYLQPRGDSYTAARIVIDANVDGPDAPARRILRSSKK